MICPYNQGVKFSLLLGLFVILVLAGYTLVGRYEDSKVIDQGQEVSRPKICVAAGLRFDEYNQGRMVFSLKTDSLKIVRKKAGFFRLGFWKVARLENVSIDFYQLSDKKKPRNDADKRVNIGTGFDADEMVNIGTGFSDIGNIFLKHDKFKFMIPKGVKGVEINNITINLHKDGKLLSAMSSDKAKLGSCGKELVFEGNVRMASGKDKLLECSKIRWLTDAGKFKTTRRYVARIDNRIIKGTGLETDCLLENLESIVRGK